MEKLLRSCYKEMNIQGVNSLLLEKRINAMNTILDDACLSREEYLSLTKWLTGLCEAPEEILILLEEQFCKYDEAFTLQGEESLEKENKEIVLLCTVLLYQYCSQEREYEFAIRILCADGAGYPLKSRIMTEKFNALVDEWRIAQRRAESFVQLKKMTALEKTKKELNAAIKDGTDFDIDVQTMKFIVDQMDVCQANIRILAQNEKTYSTNLKAKSEETNLLWWMVSEWSECNRKLYKHMSVEEAALMIPVELNDLLEFSLYPYAIRQMIQKVLSVTEGFTEEKQSLNEMVKLAGEELAERVAISYGQAQIDGRIQPILYALIKKTEAEDENALLAVFRAGAKRSMDEIKLSPAEFSLQLCRELELIRCSVKEQ